MTANIPHITLDQLHILLMEHIRRHSNQSQIPVLMVSSETDDSRLTAVQQAGISAICDKP